MFIGHFAVGFAAKKISPQLNLALLFMACQLLDIIWPVLVLFGIEQVTVDHSATVVTPYDFSHYPFSHSLLMTLLYSLLAGFITAAIVKSKKSGVVVGLVVLSHWILDFLSHRADLPIIFSDYKVGLGLWNFTWMTLILESLLFAGGIHLYIKSTPSLSKKRKYILGSLITFLFALYLGALFGPKTPIDTHPNMIAGAALSVWLIIIWAYYADKITDTKSTKE